MPPVSWLPFITVVVMLLGHLITIVVLFTRSKVVIENVVDRVGEINETMKTLSKSVNSLSTRVAILERLEERIHEDRRKGPRRAEEGGGNETSS